MSTDSISHDLIAQAISWRHHLHQHPELAYREARTAEFVACQLSKFGLAIHRGLAGTGVVGTLSRGTSKRVVAIRADMDALPIQEQSGAGHASCTAGAMHACGHDGHVAIALAAARACSQLTDIDGTVHFIFQPAEENEGGGQRMVEEGLFRLFPCDAVYALHNWPALPLGTCVARDGAMMAAFGTFDIEVSGRGCHGAMPQEGVDSVLAASHLVAALQSVVSRNVDPLQACVISVTQIHGGDTWNAVPDKCIIRGTSRWFDDAVGNIVERRVVDLSQLLAAAFGCKAHVRYLRRVPATINHSDAARFVRNVAIDPSLNLNIVDAAPAMASEDFAFMLKDTPGCYIWLGAARVGENPGLHSPQYDFNDELIPWGVRLWVSIVTQSLSSQ